eukprot:comp17474_c0_seq1/m.16950 comp17474_c0_seq1/g.16950  ORF comp17474_c0_seq1/g.16950 comp17474_c0_seq1/m.16950 type:complete len:529 (-) comp17474_c0_seq1:546-2132(-)
MAEPGTILTVLHNGKVWQWFSEGLTANWLAVDETTGKIEAVGEGEVSSTYLERAAKVVDLSGACVLPGFIDSHIHVGWLGQNSGFCDLSGVRSVSELCQTLKTYAEAHPDYPAIIGQGWDQFNMGEQFPCRADLDAVVPNRPVYLHRYCFHIAACNTKALEMAGVLHKPDGEVSEDIEYGDDGLCNGIVKENATDTVYDKLRDNRPEARLVYFRRGLNMCAEKGVTAVQTIDEEAWSIYKTLAERDEIPIRVYLTVWLSDLDNGSAPPAKSAVGSMLFCDRVKLWQDGSLGGATAAMRIPYKDSDNYGMLIWSQEDLNKHVQRVKDLGYRLEIHAIGDKAAESVLEAYEKANITKEDRAFLTHCQVLGKDIIPRMLDIGVIANIQPSMIPADTHLVAKHLPESLHEYAYAWKTLLEAGIPCSGGSDSPIENYNPMVGMYHAINRSNTPNDPDCFHPSQRLTFSQSLRLYTVGGAYAAGQSGRLGSLEAGYQGDFVVLQDNVVEDPTLLKTALVDMTWVDGKLRFKRCA